MAVLVEPWISGLKADRFIKLSGFEYSYRIETRGFSGRIWIMWKKELVVTIERCHPQFIHTRIEPQGGLVAFSLMRFMGAPTTHSGRN